MAMRWLLGPKGDYSRLIGFGVGGSASIIGAALTFRQWHLRSSPVVEAAKRQLHEADQVRQLLGGPVLSSSGMVGGYSDPLQGTAVVTIPIVSEGGVRATARAEAEAEWVVRRAEASARGERPPEPNKMDKCRWLVRHLDVTIDSPAAGAPDKPVTIYSLPANIELSPWAPSRERSAWLPGWVQALLPNPSGVRRDEAMPRMLAVGTAAVAMHAAAFLVLRKRMRAEKALRRAEALLLLPETRGLSAMRDAAVKLAHETLSPTQGAVERQAGSVLYGRAAANEVVAYTALQDQKELFFRAQLVGGSGVAHQRDGSTPMRAPEQARPASPTPSGGTSADAQHRAGGRRHRGGGARGHGGGRRESSRHEWVFTHVSIQPTVLWSEALIRLPPTSTADEYLEALLAVEAPSIPINDRRVRGMPPP